MKLAPWLFALVLVLLVAALLIAWSTCYNEHIYILYITYTTFNVPVSGFIRIWNVGQLFPSNSCVHLHAGCLC